jgi:5-methylcytosine-specific restriction endonuclease McrA
VEAVERPEDLVGRWFYDGLPGRPQTEPSARNIYVRRPQGYVECEDSCAVCTSRLYAWEEPAAWWGTVPVCSKCVTDFYWWCERRDRARAKAKAAKRIARKKGLKTEPYSRLSILLRDRSVCHICGKKVGDAYHIDHLVPLAWSSDDHPGDVPSNVAIAHPGCNSRKNASYADWEKHEFLKLCPDQPAWSVQ